MKMQIQKKHLSTAIALALTLTIAATLVTASPIVFGQFLPNARQVDVFAYASPNIVGKGQSTFITGWVYPAPSNTSESYHGLIFTFKKPDGTSFNVTRDSFLAGTVEYSLIPDQVGNWSVTLWFPGDLKYLDRLPGVSAPYKFTVQEEPIPIPDYTALPSGPWGYPVSEANYEWWRITGEWNGAQGPTLDRGMSGLENVYTTGPETSHILWKKEVTSGGLIGGWSGHYGITKPEAEPRGMVAAHGKLYTIRKAGDGGAAAGSAAAAVTPEVPTVYCLDQFTGEELWSTPLPVVNVTTGKEVAAAKIGGKTLQIVAAGMEQTLLSAGFVENRQNVLSSWFVFQLWVSGGGLWNVDPITGRILWYQLEPVLSPTYHQGAWYINNYPVAGNFSCIAIYPGRDEGVSFPTMVLTSNDPVAATSLVWTKNVSKTGITASKIVEGYIVQNLYNSTTGQRKLITWDAKTGELVANGTYGGYFDSDAPNPCYGEGVYSALGADGRTRAWSFKTGSLLWTSEPRVTGHGTWGDYTGAAGLGMIWSASYDGYKYAYNATNGNLVWKQFTGTDNPYNYEYATNAPTTWGWTISADNKVYWASGEHTTAAPTQRGDMFYCNDATTGELLWRLPYFKNNRYGIGAGISSGMLWSQNEYDGCLYMFGKGVTKTEVSAPQTSIPLGSSLLIQGTVKDLSPGTKERSMADRFPDGVPAVADDGMDDWMAYLYTLCTTGPLIDLAKVKGVTVFLQAMRSDGTIIDITHVTSDIMGHYEYTWTPPDKDTYRILATFEGSKSYYSSSAQTGLSVGAATPEPATPEAAPDNTYTIIGTGIAIIIAVAVATVLILRKRS